MVRGHNRFHLGNGQSEWNPGSWVGVSCPHCTCPFTYRLKLESDKGKDISLTSDPVLLEVQDKNENLVSKQ